MDSDHQETDGTPDWTLLPQEPVAFFGLDEDFDRRDLKRAYGKLIRKFKPETHPAEFQRIRAAYEQLESANRYGTRQVVARQQEEAWQRTNVVGESSTPSRRSQPGSAADSELHPSIQQAIDSPQNSYATLSELTDRTPQDFYTLAILSDLADGKDRNEFVKWIMRGLKEYPTDPGLQSLMLSYLKFDLPDEQAAGILTALARMLPGDCYYRLTEPIWDRMLSKLPFDQFDSLLDRCRQLIKVKSDLHEAAFFLHLLKGAIWKAPAEWTEAAYDRVASMGIELGHGFESELEFLDALRHYHGTVREKIMSDELLKSVDRMIRDYCDSDWEKGGCNCDTGYGPTWPQ